MPRTKTHIPAATSLSLVKPSDLVSLSIEFGRVRLANKTLAKRFRWSATYAQKDALGADTGLEAVNVSGISVTRADIFTDAHAAAVASQRSSGMVDGDPA